MDASRLAEAGLHGWKGAVGRRLSRPVSRRTPLNEEQAKAIFAAVVFLVSLRSVVKTIAALARRRH